MRTSRSTSRIQSGEEFCLTGAAAGREQKAVHDCDGYVGDKNRCHLGCIFLVLALSARCDKLDSQGDYNT
jgi:hypothetical protein